MISLAETLGIHPTAAYQLDQRTRQFIRVPGQGFKPLPPRHDVRGIPRRSGEKKISLIEMNRRRDEVALRAARAQIQETLSGELIEDPSLPSISVEGDPFTPVLVFKAPSGLEE